MAFENIVGKGENAGNHFHQHFLCIAQCFVPLPKQILDFQSYQFLLSNGTLNFRQSKNLSFGKGLKVLSEHYETKCASENFANIPLKYKQ